MVTSDRGFAVRAQTGLGSGCGTEVDQTTRGQGYARPLTVVGVFPVSESSERSSSQLQLNYTRTLQGPPKPLDGETRTLDSHRGRPELWRSITPGLTRVILTPGLYLIESRYVAIV